MREPLFVFVDECGEEGFSGKASEWFILSAAIQRGEQSQTVRTCYEQFRTDQGRGANWYFHFVKAEHRARLAFIRSMKEASYVFMSVAVHKPSLLKTHNFRRPYFLYFYAAKLLLERVSWWARTRNEYVAGLYFSSRRGLRRAAVMEYLRVLQRDNIRELSNSIYWPAIRRAIVFVKPNKEMIGLQMADCMASSVGQAISTHPYAVTEPRYLLELKDQIYKTRTPASVTD
jgi:hypothetical protein